VRGQRSRRGATRPSSPRSSNVSRVARRWLRPQADDPQGRHPQPRRTMMWSDALAQTAAPAGQSGDPRIGMLLSVLQFLPIFLILYFLLIRPQQQQKKKHDEMLKALKKGDRVLTTGGL